MLIWFISRNIIEPNVKANNNNKLLGFAIALFLLIERRISKYSIIKSVKKKKEILLVHVLSCINFFISRDRGGERD
jgi:hypothetical protein